jgi:Fe-S-cluster-containing dehydrogenase component/formate-dependent nitrite reductase membrane component NrfD
MPTFGFVIDNRKCIGCHACTVACKSEHKVPVGVDRTWVKYVEKGTFPHNRRLFSVMRCNHCDWAPCVTICPVTALYRRADGVVDFNNERCIGCKSCLQACPYDALYIDPDTNTAAKCNFCTHRLEAGLQPSCVVVCPEQAIIAGDMADPDSEISRLLDRHPVQVRKPEKGTRPKLFYIEADEASLVPTRTGADGWYLWSQDPKSEIRNPKSEGNGNPKSENRSVASRVSLRTVAPDPSPRRVYDVRPRPPAWGWEVVAYTWTKSIAAGSFLAVLAARLLEGAEGAARLALPMGLAALVFLTLTAGLLVADLKQPRRFLYVLLRPQWRSWLVRGAYLLTGYGALVTAWLLASTAGATALADVLLGPGAVLAVGAAAYTAFLFAQAKGRDFWQNPLLSIHLLAHAALAGGAVWMIVDDSRTARGFTAAALVFSLLTLLAEILTTPPTADAHRAMHWIIGRPMGRWFWGAGMLAGHVLPLAVLGAGLPGMGAALLVLAGMFVIEWLWVYAPQQVPLS